MTNKEAIEYGKKWDEAIESRGDTPFSEVRQFLNLAIKTLEVVEKIKKAYSANREIEEIDDAMCFANATYNILCEAYGSDITCES